MIAKIRISFRQKDSFFGKTFDGIAFQSLKKKKSDMRAEIVCGSPF